ncbi:MAG: alpha/beta hydrolase [Psychrosphaera sp.]|nr:alpha/beta hydrolase [Psychrosphaera sp.]
MMVSAKLKPFLADVNKAIAQAKADKIAFSAEIVRVNLDKLGALVTTIPQVANITDTTVQGVPVRVYLPKTEAEPAPGKANDLSVLIYFHGGGHMCGSVQLYDPMCRKIASATGCIVISVEYRLAPEHPYPAGIDDAQLVIENYAEVLGGLNAGSELIIAGDSAGGAICTTLAMNNQHNGAVNIDKQILIYPSVDYTMSHPSVAQNGKGFLLESDKIAWYFDSYFQNGEDRKFVSPLFGPITSQLPKTLVVTAGCDPLRDEGLAYVAALKQQAVPVQHEHFDDMVHAFMNIEDLVPEECERLFEIIGLFAQSIR